MRSTCFGDPHDKEDIGVSLFEETTLGVAVKIMVPVWIPIIIRQLNFRVPEKGP